MLRRCLVILLAVSGLMLLGYGGMQWRRNYTVRASAQEFVEAMIAGNAPAALLRMDPDWRKRVQQQGRSFQSRVFVATPDAKFRVHSSTVENRDARVRFWIQREGFVIQPVLRMKQLADGDWYVSGFENVAVDPIWTDIENARRQAQSVDVAAELNDALKAAPGVSIEPIESEAP